MPTGYWMFGAECREWALRAFPDREATRILDVGAGAGKWRDLLYDYPQMDAVEVWGPSIGKYGLRDRYGSVHETDARMLAVKFYRDFDLVILGDVLEHMAADEASAILDRIRDAGAAALIALPYRLPQDECDGNPYEVHVQDDLTPEIIAARYPRAELMVKGEAYGIYVQDPRSRRTKRAPASVEPFEVDVRELVRGRSLVIATPTHGSEVSLRYVQSLWRTQAMAHDLGLRIAALFVDGAGVTKGRNQLVARFMAMPGATHLLFVDADQGWEPKQVLRLLALDRDVIGCPVRKKTTQLAWNLNFLEGASVIDRGALEIAEIGTGFLMISREAIARMMKEFPQLKLDSEREEEGPDFEAHYFALFDNEIVSRAYRPEDYTFCRRWRSIGGRVWADPHGEVVHVGQYEFRGSIESMLMGVDAPT